MRRLGTRRRLAECLIRGRNRGSNSLLLRNGTLTLRLTDRWSRRA